MTSNGKSLPVDERNGSCVNEADAGRVVVLASLAAAGVVVADAAKDTEQRSAPGRRSSVHHESPSWRRQKSRIGPGHQRDKGWCAAAARKFVNGASSTSPAGRRGRREDTSITRARRIGLGVALDRAFSGVEETADGSELFRRRPRLSSSTRCCSMAFHVASNTVPSGYIGKSRCTWRREVA